MSDNAVAIVEKSRELSVTEVKAQVTKVQNLMHDLMKDGTHYGESFPGDTKKNLLKPGADKLCFMFRLRSEFVQNVKDLPNGHMEVTTRCQIFHIESGQKIAEGVGLASTMESKYRWRNAARKCPHCGKETIIVGKKEYGGGFVCFGKKGGCGAKFADDDTSITGQVTGKVENTDIADTYNTVIKMSKKRAYVDATITACAASDIFSQDAEDFRDVTEETAKEAAQDEPRNVTDLKPAAEPAKKTMQEEYNETMKEIGSVLASVDSAGNPVFNEKEQNEVRNRVKVDLAKIPTPEDKLQYITLLLEDLNFILNEKLDSKSKKEAAAAPENQKPEAKSEESDVQHFEDDIPESKPKKPGKGTKGANGELDIY